MSPAVIRFTFFVAFALSTLLQPARVDAVSNLDEYGDDWETKDAMDGEVPVGRTLLLLHLLKQKLLKFHDSVTTSPPFTGCICVPFYLCDANSNVIANGAGVIDFRNRFTSRRCTGDIEVCCYLRGSNTIATTLPPTTPTPSTTPSTIPTTRPPTMPSTLPTTRPPMTIPTTQQPPIVTILPIQTCTCVPIYQCAAYGGGNLYNPGSGQAYIDPRQQAQQQQQQQQPRQYLNTCVGAFVCCSYASASTFPPYTLPNTIPTTQPPPSTTLAPPPPIVHGQSCICMLIAACSLGYIDPSGAGVVDPRRIQGQPAGSCGAAADSVCCKIGQPPAGITKNAATPDECRCVPAESCADGDAVTHDKIGAIDPRFGPCASATLVCCRTREATAKQSIVLPASSQQTCGSRDTSYAADARLPLGAAHFAEFPWMALLLIRKPGANDVFQCGGSLINGRTVLTAAHCVTNCEPGSLVARLGEYNAAATSEALPFQEIGVQSILLQPQFFAGGLYNDVALLILAEPANYAIHVRPVCLPSQGQVFAAGTRCFASGWGRSAFDSSGQYQTTLRKVELPIVGSASCEARLRATRLGQAFQLHSSFVCAGGEANKDTCYKDGGGPLVCQDTNTGRFTQVGVVSWGIGCGSNTPGVYANVAQQRQWIDQQLAANGITA